MTLCLLFLASIVWGGPIEDALEEVAPLRALRLAKDAPEIPARAYQRAARGSPVAGVLMTKESKAGKGWGVMIYDFPVEVVWMAVNDEPAMAEWLPVSISSVIGGIPGAHGHILFEYMPIPVFTNRWWIVDVSHNADLYRASGGKVWEQSWVDATDPNRLAGTPYAEYRDIGMPVDWSLGSWMLVQLSDNRTLGEFFTWTDPGGRLPPGPTSRFASGAIKDTMRAVEALAKEREHTSRTGFVRPNQEPL
ncbi:MAG: hypothetical protein JRI25_01465 [Deltaproteobacteria bacterium]|nr:hypothetical protein [Deltaproteobacteria bacterium]MBW2253248.1 hypothetical protein [Deltaproteobacteria bacterium]